VRPFLVLSATVTTQNAACFHEVFEVAEQARVDGLGASYGWFQTAESCRHHEQVMADELGTFAFSQRGFVRQVDPRETAAAVVESVRRIASRRWPFRYRFLPNLSLEEIPKYFEEHSCRFGHDRCIVPWSVVGILPNGDVTTCSDYPDYIVGNIRNAGIHDIWNNERYRKFRILLQNKGLLPVCSRCCGLLADS
jgi:radical SAM protein with 4Fe4S-binding SPASM domain